VTRVNEQKSIQDRQEAIQGYALVGRTHLAIQHGRAFLRSQQVAQRSPARVTPAPEKGKPMQKTVFVIKATMTPHYQLESSITLEAFFDNQIYAEQSLQDIKREFSQGDMSTFRSVFRPGFLSANHSYAMDYNIYRRQISWEREDIIPTMTY
jgi:hypothetical protein